MKAEKGNTVNIKKIGATLKHGRFVAYNIYLGCIGIIFSFSAVVIWLLFLQKGIHNRALGYIVIFSFWALFFIGSLYTIIKTVRIQKEVLKWLEDAVEIDACAERVIRVDYDGLKVHFVYNNEKLTRLSRCKHWRSPEGFSLFWEDYFDKNFKIYYSSKYDEVMLFIAKMPTK